MGATTYRRTYGGSVAGTRSWRTAKGRRVGTATGADLVVDVGDMLLDGADAQMQVVGNPLVAPPSRHQTKHLDLTRGQSGGMGRGRR